MGRRRQLWWQPSCACLPPAHTAAAGCSCCSCCLRVAFLELQVNSALAPGLPACHPLSQVWKNGQKIDELVGASKDRLLALIKKHAEA